ncbi:serrate RNA effector molecule [Tripterygium wilfordii]|uniref:Serrate RNA effector molecule n=1 Tax=Tripterygium wilfordii TaxID=458696 RepID=A0A7J7D0H7_TRIWF|nr:protein SRC2 homolog [Tripterygium wilfordii]KAF5739865.1 serrate RNA effector molecule [Tripterygium wilfordii]
MERRPLDMTLVSAKDLKDVNMFSKMDVYAVVSVHGDPEKQKQKTPIDKDCGSNPNWNHKMKFTVDEAAANQNRLTLKIKIKTDRTLGKDKAIGEVHVPIKELFDQKDNKKADEFVTYSVRTSNGKSKGALNLSYKFGETFKVAAPPPRPAHAGSKSGEPVMAYPPPAGYPAGSSSGYPQYPPPGGYPAPPPHAEAGKYPYQYPPPGGYQPPQHGYQGYPPQPGYGGYPGYPPQQPGYGAYPGYPPVQQPPKKNSGAGKMALGVGAGLLGGLLVGDMISDAADMGDGGFDGGFDF